MAVAGYRFLSLELWGAIVIEGKRFKILIGRLGYTVVLESL